MDNFFANKIKSMIKTINYNWYLPILSKMDRWKEKRDVQQIMSESDFKEQYNSWKKKASPFLLPTI